MSCHQQHATRRPPATQTREIELPRGTVWVETGNMSGEPCPGVVSQCALWCCSRHRPPCQIRQRMSLHTHQNRIPCLLCYAHALNTAVVTVSLSADHSPVSVGDKVLVLWLACLLSFHGSSHRDVCAAASVHRQTRQYTMECRQVRRDVYPGQRSCV